ncbi:MAG: hypothetical protein CMD26_03885 [Flavobacteriales bacterium]|nr:hypothetical protein [Flavobacteriales bacterium]
MKIKLIELLIVFLSKIPLVLLYAIARILTLINPIFIKYRIQLINKNLTNSFPKLEKHEISKLKDQFYIFFFNVMAEVIKSRSLKEKEILNRVKIKNINLIKNNIHNQKPTILITSHYNNWEWHFLRLSLIKNINLTAVYKPLSNEYINKVLLKIRGRFGAILIPLKKWKYFIMKNKNKPYVFMFINDQVPVEVVNGKRINFLNQSTLFDNGAEKTAQILNADVIYSEMQLIKKGHYIITLKKLNSTRITEKYAKLLETTIQKQPQKWLWSHNRWKR